MVSVRYVNRKSTGQGQAMVILPRRRSVGGGGAVELSMRSEGSVVCLPRQPRVLLLQFIDEEERRQRD